MPKHTKGPWTITKAYKHAPHTWLQFVFADHSETAKRPAEAMGMTKEEAEANARLIAASPCLYKAVKDALAYLLTAMPQDGISESLKEQMRDVIKQVEG